MFSHICPEAGEALRENSASKKNKKKRGGGKRDHKEGRDGKKSGMRKTSVGEHDFRGLLPQSIPCKQKETILVVKVQSAKRKRVVKNGFVKGEAS